MRIMRLLPILTAILLTVSTPATAPAAAPTLANLRCEYRTDPLGLDAPHPRLSWELRSDARSVRQSAYRIRVARTAEELSGGAPLWDTGRLASERSNQISYQGPALGSGQRCYWQVQVWDENGETSGWSRPACWEMGLLDPKDWHTEWITPELPQDHTKSNPVALLRREFMVARKVAKARLYATAQGLYEFELNGQRVGDACLTPGWTSYDFRYQYQVYDVTASLRVGTNCLGALLGEGWYRGHMVWENRRNNYGEDSALLAQLLITYDDGSTEVCGTDGKWRTTTGPILLSDIYDGETYDARLERPGWSQPGHDASGWAPVRTVPAPKARLVASGPVVRPQELIKPVKVLHTPAGETVLDLGQNMVGRMRFHLEAPAGTTITLRHAEVLDQTGNLYTANLRAAAQTVRYTAKGGGETFEPHFTFQGFRYVAVEGWPGEPKPADFSGVVLHTTMEPTGSFTCSDPLINQLQHNIVWGQKGNFVDIPSDCPQRDERLGWTGDAQVFARTACFNFDSADFYTKWLRDLALDQQDDGAVPHVIPDVLSHRTRKGNSGATGWADAAVVVPWTLYLVYGDQQILAEQYASMKAWVEYMRRAAGTRYIWNTGEHFGDWLCFATNDPGLPGASTDKDLLQTAYFCRSTSILQQAAQVLGREEDARDYAALAKKIRAAFAQEFLAPSGRLTSNTQTAYVLALAFDLLPEQTRAKSAGYLAANVERYGHLTTGFLGTPLLCPVLTDTGRLDLAYRLLNRKDYPSWLYPVTRGATTIWERWDGIRPDGSFQDVIMNSFNHYAYGAIGEWLYRYVAGIELDPADPGYHHFFLQPNPGGGLTQAAANFRSIYGRIAAGWRIEGTRFCFDAEVPANTTATMRLPHVRLASVRESGHPLAQATGISQARQQGDDVLAELGSGNYHFECEQSADTSTPRITP